MFILYFFVIAIPSATHALNMTKPLDSKWAQNRTKYPMIPTAVLKEIQKSESSHTIQQTRLQQPPTLIRQTAILVGTVASSATQSPRSQSDSRSLSSSISSISITTPPMQDASPSQTLAYAKLFVRKVNQFVKTPTTHARTVTKNCLQKSPELTSKSKLVTIETSEKFAHQSKNRRRYDRT